MAPLATACAGTAQCRPTVGTHHHHSSIGTVGIHQVNAGHEKTRHKGGFCKSLIANDILAERTGLEPATPGVTGRYSNRLNYRCA